MLAKNQISKKNIINILICLLPVSYIVGNLLLNLNILSILIFFFLSFKLEILKFRLDIIDKLILILFFYILSNGLINNYFNFDHKSEENVILFKSLAYLRFLILYFVFRYLIRNNLIKYNFLFFSFGFLALFVSLDIIYQFFFRVDFFGFEAPVSQRRLAGPFGDEWIAGSFIQRFYLFLIFYLLIFSKIKDQLKLNSLNILVLFLSVLGVVMAGNRVPAVMFIISVFLIMILEKSLRKILAILIFISISSIYFFSSNNATLKVHYNSFFEKGSEVITYFYKKYDPVKTELPKQEIASSICPKLSNKKCTSYIKEIETGLVTWQQNKIFGGGIKSFYYNCAKINESINPWGCSSHPHSYYIQLAAELGIVGLVIISIIFFIIIIRFIKNYFFEENFYKKKMLLPFFILFVIEIFPLKTTGSFFTTTNASYLFIIISFIIGLMEMKKVE